MRKILKKTVIIFVFGLSVPIAEALNTVYFITWALDNVQNTELSINSVNIGELVDNNNWKQILPNDTHFK
ncbi:MAG: hypothetical protein IKM79_01140 [Bacteroidales bacterium]|nr:hypothetical protein [Bacteroidales bacterium]